jgi:hypothetical protein
MKSLLGGRHGGSDLDARVRTAAFAFVTELTGRHGGTPSWSLLKQGFRLED